jgi:hypothetical protein
MYPRARGRSAAALGMIIVDVQILVMLSITRVGKGLKKYYI